MSSRNKALWRSVSSNIESLCLDCFKCAKCKECQLHENSSKFKPKSDLDFLCWPLVKAAVLEQDKFDVPFPVKGEQKHD